MAAVKPSIKDILCLEKIPIILKKSYEIEAFVMGHHVYKQRWTSFVGEKLDAAMQPSNIKDKYAVAIFQGEETRSLVIFLSESRGSLQRQFFIF